MKSEVKGLASILDALSRQFDEIAGSESPEAALKTLAEKEIERALPTESAGGDKPRPYGGTGRLFGGALREVLCKIQGKAGKVWSVKSEE